MLRYEHAARSAAETAANRTHEAQEANNLVFRALDADPRRPAPNNPNVASAAAQELPTLDLIGAAIARAARIAAAEDRTRLHFPSIVASRAALLASQAAGLLKPSARELDALFADLASGAATREGRLVPGHSGAKSVVWRLHAAPAAAGAPVAERTSDTCGVPA